MTITAVPTRTIGSLGPEKSNRRAVSDPYYQIDADEWNLLCDCAAFLVDEVGTETGYASTSLQGRVGALETTTADGVISLAQLMNPQFHYKADDFDDWTALSTPGWDNGIGSDPWTIETGEHNGLSASFANDCMMRSNAVYTCYPDYPRLRFIARSESWDSSVGSEFQSVLRAVSDDTVYAGVRIYDYGAPTNRRIEAVRADGMGGVTPTDICEFVDGDNYDIAWRIGWNDAETEVGLHVSINGAAEVYYGVCPVFAGAANYFYFGAPHVALGAGTFYLNQVRRMAIWTPSGLTGMEIGG